MGYRVWYAICNLFGRKLMTIITILMLTVSFVVAENAAAMYLSFHYAEWEARDIIVEPYNEVYRVDASKYITGFCNEEDLERLIRFYHMLGDVDGVAYAGMFVSRSNAASEYEEPSILYISDELLQMCGIEQDFGQGGKQEVRAFAGKNLMNDFPVGKVWERSMEYGIRINGVLDGKCYISDACFASGESALQLDDYIVCSFDDWIAIDNWFFLNAMNNIIYVVDKEIDAEQVMNHIYDLAEEQGLDVYGIHSADRMFEQLARDAFDDAGGRYFMPLVMLLCSCMSIIVSAIYSLQVNRRDMGIMLSNSMTRADIIGISFYEIAIKTFLAFLFSLLYLLLKSAFLDEQASQMYTILLPIYVCFAVIIVVTVGIVPYLYVGKQVPRNMIGDNI